MSPLLSVPKVVQKEDCICGVPKVEQSLNGALRSGAAVYEEPVDLHTQSVLSQKDNRDEYVLYSLLYCDC